MKINVEELKRTPILDIAQRLNIKVSKNKALCFKHNEKTPSLNFTISKNLWHCFGCGAGGDSIKLVMEYLNLDFKDACNWIMGSSIAQAPSYVNSKSVTVTAVDDCLPDPEVYEWLINTSSLSKQGLEYLVDQRGFSKKTLEYFNIKDIPNPAERFIEIKQKWGQDRLQRCGLVNMDDSGKGRFVWWSHIILFPFYNSDNKVTYIQGRQLGKKEPRYINLKGIKTEIFNLTILKKLNAGEYIYINEGLTDTLAAYEVGLKSIGIMGANGFKEEWARQFMNLNVRVIPDSDAAGIKFANSIEEIFMKIGKSVQIIKLPQNMDFAEFIKK